MPCVCGGGGERGSSQQSIINVMPPPWLWRPRCPPPATPVPPLPLAGLRDFEPRAGHGLYAAHSHPDDAADSGMTGWWSAADGAVRAARKRRGRAACISHVAGQYCRQTSMNVSAMSAGVRWLGRRDCCADCAPAVCLQVHAAAGPPLSSCHLVLTGPEVQAREGNCAL